MNGKQERDAGRREAGSEADVTLKERLRKVEAILDIGARRFLESRGKLVAPLGARKHPTKR